MNLRVSVLGAGSFGTTMAHLFTQNAPTLLWCRRSEIADEINQEHRNESYLPGHSIAEDVRATASLKEAVREADVLVMGVPTVGMRAALEEVSKHIRPWVPIVSLAKGLEPGSHLRMTEVIRDVLPEHRAAALSGPNLAKEIMSGFAAASVIAVEDPELAKQLQGLFHCGVFRVYTNRDVIGCELGGGPQERHRDRDRHGRWLGGR